jgi:diguanylate cyclase (GGDEF)-like protein
MPSTSFRSVSTRGVLTVALVAGISAHAAHATFGFGGYALDRFFDDWLLNALILATSVACLLRGLLVPAERLAWLVLGAAMLSWSGGFIYWTLFIVRNPAPPYPSPADALWLAYYPAAYVALVLIIRSRIREFHKSLWLDGLIGGLAVASVGAALVFGAVLSSTGGNATQIAINLAYPLGDMLLVAFVVSMFALTGWRPGRAGLLLGIGFTLNAVGDSLWVYAYATGTYSHGSLTETIWPAATGLIALAAWQPTRRTPAVPLRGPRILVVPVVSGVVAMGVLLSMRVSSLNDVALVLATATLLAVLARLVLTLREHLRLVESSRGEANTDALTGLGNRRKLMPDLEAQLLLASPASGIVLALFDLDGFKTYNDTFGHPAGDALLARLGRNLAGAVGTNGSAYRVGGDEFCALIDATAARPDTVIAAAKDALQERGEGFEISCSAGTVNLPLEASDAAHALQLADQRMYAHKSDGRTSARSQVRDVLVRALEERGHGALDPLRDAGELSRKLAKRLALSSEQIDEVVRAAELRDVGMVSIPDTVLRKPGALNEEEWALIRQHPIVGETILLAAPALGPVAGLVRSSHERHDGRGYPDGLRGEQIPLGARIIAICDAFVAMISARTYREAWTREKALAELRRCAGSQFDPAMVNAFGDLLSAEDSSDRVAVRAGAADARPAAAAPEADGSADAIMRLLAVARQQLDMDVAVLGEFAGDQELFRWVDAGDGIELGQDMSFPRADGYCQRLIDNRLSNVVGDAQHDERVRHLDVTRELGIGAWVGVPVKLPDGRLYGALCCISAEARPLLSDRDVRFMRELGHIVSVELDTRESKARTESTSIRALVAALGARDPETMIHSDVVVKLAGQLAARFGLSEDAQNQVRQVAALHDIGKVGVPDHILHKPGPLDDAELAIMRRHPAMGAEILGSTETLAHLAPAVLAEHERWDGTGYPNGLAGEQIPLAARIVFVCDAYDAMTTDRPYRSAMAPEAAITELRRTAGTQFDPIVVAALLAALDGGTDAAVTRRPFAGQPGHA